MKSTISNCAVSPSSPFKRGDLLRRKPGKGSECVIIFFKSMNDNYSFIGTVLHGSNNFSDGPGTISNGTNYRFTDFELFTGTLTLSN